MAQDKGYRKGNAYRNYYGQLPDRTVENRKKRLADHQARQPNDEQAAAASPNYRRKAPNQKGGWLTRTQMKNLDMISDIDPDAGGRVYGDKDLKTLAQIKSHSRAVARQRQYETSKAQNRKQPNRLMSDLAHKLEELNERPPE